MTPGAAALPASGLSFWSARAASISRPGSVSAAPVAPSIRSLTALMRRRTAPKRRPHASPGDRRAATSSALDDQLGRARAEPLGAARRDDDAVAPAAVVLDTVDACRRLDDEGAIFLDEDV